MREHDLFIDRMFAIVAKTHKDKISFGEFLDTVIKFTSGIPPVCVCMRWVDVEVKSTMVYTSL